MRMLMIAIVALIPGAALGQGLTDGPARLGSIYAPRQPDLFAAPAYEPARPYKPLYEAPGSTYRETYRALENFSRQQRLEDAIRGRICQDAAQSGCW